MCIVRVLSAFTKAERQKHLRQETLQQSATYLRSFQRPCIRETNFVEPDIRRPPRLLIKNFLSARNMEEAKILPVPRLLWRCFATNSEPMFQPYRTMLDDRNRWTDFQHLLDNTNEGRMYLRRSRSQNEVEDGWDQSLE